MQDGETTRRTAGTESSGSSLSITWESGHLRWPVPMEGSVVIGRGAGVNIHVQSSTISRQHARLYAGTPLRLEDLGSANGTRVNGDQLLPGQQVEIRLHDIVEMGAVTMVLTPDRSATSGPGLTMQDVMARLDIVARGSISVTLCGETGVGKEVLARRLHSLSTRSNKPFVTVNCASLPEPLLESELFGYERGAFSGANTSKPGLVDEAKDGTLLLDELGEMPLRSQAKLLRMIETQEVRRLGATRSHPINVRFVAATNQDLESAIAQGTFRADLFYRIAGFLLYVPPLRERRDEIVSLSEQFLAETQTAKGSAMRLGDATLALLMRHNWPGNVRELRNVIESAALLCQGTVIEPVHLPQRLCQSINRSTPLTAPSTPPTETVTNSRSPVFAPVMGAQGNLEGQLSEIERQQITAALEECHGNQTRAAALLGISRRALISRIEQYGLPRPRKR